MLRNRGKQVKFQLSTYIPHGMATGTGVGTIRRRFLNSVGAIVMTVGCGGVSAEVVDRNDVERLGETADETGPIALSSTETLKERSTNEAWSADEEVFGSRVRGTIGRLTRIGFRGRRVRRDRPVRHYVTKTSIVFRLLLSLRNLMILAVKRIIFPSTHPV